MSSVRSASTQPFDHPASPKPSWCAAGTGFAGLTLAQPTSELPLAPPQAIDEFRKTMLARFLREFEAASSARDEAKTSRCVCICSSPD